MRTWRDKAHEVIASLSRDAWLKANTTKAGTRRKVHRQYVIPVLADELVECLATDDEARAKAIFNWEMP